MAGKYDKQIMKAPVSPKSHPEITSPIVTLRGGADWGGVPISIRFEPITQPLLMIKEPHKHEFNQFLCFLGGNATDFTGFDAEIELCLGEEVEKHVITAASFVFVPAGLIHGPLNFKVIRKPVLFCDVQLTAQYKRLPAK